MRLAMQEGSLAPEDVDYVNAHAASTPLGDKAETIAIKKTLCDRAYEIPVSSAKSMIGHLMGACGAIEAVATILCIRDQVAHPTINYHNPDPECDLDYVPKEPREVKVRFALSNSFGFGGHNACIVVRRFESK
jgi:3-oxoacyl-[acyl-carrier-protein] synthase II